METDAGRPQDQGRPHRRRKAPADPATRRLLASWQDTLRSELRAIVAALEATKPAGLVPPAEGETPAPAIALEDPRRDRYVDRGIKIAKELGASIDDDGKPADPDPSPPATPRPRSRRRRIDFGGE